MKGMHMQRMNLSRIAGTLLLAFILFAGANTYAQDNSMTKSSDTNKDQVQKWTAQLNEKVKLTDEQQTNIEALLTDYVKANSSSDMKDADKLQSAYDVKIQTILNDNQKMLYKDYSKEWWQGISKPTVQSTEKSSY
jgi:septal ring factor EnvC (AmiA/AmiB activator)